LVWPDRGSNPRSTTLEVSMLTITPPRQFQNSITINLKTDLISWQQMKLPLIWQPLSLLRGLFTSILLSLGIFSSSINLVTSIPVIKHTILSSTFYFKWLNLSSSWICLLCAFKLCWYCNYNTNVPMKMWLNKQVIIIIKHVHLWLLVSKCEVW